MQSQYQSRYHVLLDGKRTTITVDKIVSELLAVKFGYPPETPEAHTAVREWIETKLRKNNAYDRLSQRTREYAIRELTDPAILKPYWQWLADA